MEISAPGYNVMTTHYPVRLGRNRLGIMMDPKSLQASEQAEAIQSQMRPGFTLLHGFTVDEKTGHPISGVEVRFVHARAHTKSDSSGHYLFLVPTPQPEFPGGMGKDTLTFTKSGYKTMVFENFGIASEAMGVPQDIERGQGVIKSDATHKLMRR